MRDAAKDRQKIIEHLEAALASANEMNQGVLAYLIERALDEVRAMDFKRPQIVMRGPRCDVCKSPTLQQSLESRTFECTKCHKTFTAISSAID